MEYCPFCGKEMKYRQTKCDACKKGQADPDDENSDSSKKSGFVTRDAYERSVVPWWLAFVIIGIFLVGLILIFIVKQ